MKTFLFLVSGLLVAMMPLKAATTYAFDFGAGKSAPGYTRVDATTLYDKGLGYGFDLMAAPTAERFGRHALKGDACVSDQPFFFSIDVPEGDYRVTLLLGHAKKATETTIRAESRRLFFEHVKLKKGAFKELIFTTNVRYVAIDSNEKVRIKPREVNKRNWDQRLTIELNGSLTSLCALKVERMDNAVTVFLCGNSTVVDQDNEPWCGWGQMIPRFFDASVSFANYAESGEAANSFISAKRLKKIETKIKAGDYLFVEFGHNDQKQKGENVGPWTSYTKHLTTYIELARSKGAIPVLVTSMHRRSFNEEGRITNTLLEYPDAVRKLAADVQVPLIDLNAMSKIMYEAGSGSVG